MKNILFTSLIYTVLALHPSQAVNKNWVCNNNLWDNSACWSPIGQPLPGDDVFLTQSDNINRTVTFSNTDSSVNFSSLNIDSTGTGTITFSHNQGNINISGLGSIGIDGVGIYNQSGGHHIANR